MKYFTFYCLVKSNGGYALKPHINIYEDMVEIIKYKN
jgi:hypothetical protein